MRTSKNIVVFGLGYVGASLSILLAKNNNVYGIDIDNSKVEILNKGLSPIADEHISKYLNGEKGHWKNISTDEEIISAIRNTAYTGHHPCSTAKMGNENDINSVVDKDLKVFGIEGLRICDASAMPSQITGNLYATVLAMAEKASDIILKKEIKKPEF